MTEKKNSTTFETLAGLNVTGHVERKKVSGGELTYLSWAWAVDQISRFDPDWKFRVVEFDADGVEVPDGSHGRQYQKVLGGTYMVHTEVTVKGQAKRMWLPIMDGRNAAMKDEPYAVTVRTKSGSYDYTVPAVDAMALNKTIMRCLVKNLAMFGLGLYIFGGEDVPMTDEEANTAYLTRQNPETGEIIEPEPAKAEETEEMDLDAALKHCVTTGRKKFQGMSMEELIKHGLQNVRAYAEHSDDPMDRMAACIVLKAIEEGQIQPLKA